MNNKVNLQIYITLDNEMRFDKKNFTVLEVTENAERQVLFNRRRNWQKTINYQNYYF